jgi:hypothetical protein
LPVAIGLKHFSINGAFICPLTVSHLPVNAPCRGAVVGVWLWSLGGFCLKRATFALMGTKLSQRKKKINRVREGFFGSFISGGEKAYIANVLIAVSMFMRGFYLEVLQFLTGLPNNFIFADI